MKFEEDDITNDKVNKGDTVIKRWIANQSEDEKFLCEICQETFEYKKSLIGHKVCKHGKKGETINY